MKIKLNMYALGLLMVIPACKSVGRGRHVQPTAPIVETSAEQNPAPPDIKPPQSATPIIPEMGVPKAPEPAGGQLVRIPEPIPPAPYPGLAHPESLEVFSLRSIPIEQPGLTAQQFRVDLKAKSAAIDELANDQWKARKNISLTADQITRFKVLLSGLKPSSYPTCNDCRRNVHLLVMEGIENDRKAVSYAMNEACICGGNDERKSTLSYPNLKEMTEILNK